MPRNRSHSPEDDSGGDLGLSSASGGIFNDSLPSHLTRMNPPAPLDLRGGRGEYAPRRSLDGGWSPGYRDGNGDGAQAELESLLMARGAVGAVEDGMGMDGSLFMQQLTERRMNGVNGVRSGNGSSPRANGASKGSTQATVTPQQESGELFSSSYLSASSSSSIAGPGPSTMLRRSSSQATSPTTSVRTLQGGGTITPTSSGNGLNRSRTMPRMRKPSQPKSENDPDTDEEALSPLQHSPRPMTQAPTSPFLPASTTIPMSRYMSDLLICNFDLDRGPVVERRMAGRPWAKGEKANVAFSAFPDTSLFAEGGIGYEFKIREGNSGSEEETPKGTDEGPSYFELEAEVGTEDGAGSSSSSNTSNQDQESPSFLSVPNSHSRPTTPPTQTASFFGPLTEPPTPLHLRFHPLSQSELTTSYRVWDSHGRHWLYGFVWFQQKKDKSISRGYMQKSVVVLTHLDWPGLFGMVVEMVGGMYFKHGHPALVAACQSVARWPDLIPGATLQLSLFANVLVVRIPDASDASQIPRVTVASRAAPSPYPEILPTLPAIYPLRAFSTLLPSLWHLWECIILGEPVLVVAPDPKTCSDVVCWLRDFLRPISATMYDFRPYLHIHDMDFRLLINSDKPQAGLVIGVTNPFLRDAASHWPNIVHIGGGKVSAAFNGLPQPEGFQSKRKRHVSKDRALLNRLEMLASAGKLDDPSGNAALRTHFMQLTEKMLAPINRYIISLRSFPGSLESNRPFSVAGFLAHLKANAPNPLQFRTKGLSGKSRSESDFYTAFCTGIGFAGWLKDKVDASAVPSTMTYTATPRQSSTTYRSSTSSCIAEGEVGKLHSHHSHSGEFCRHAKQDTSLRDVVEAAIERGFGVYGLSEHCPRYRKEDLYPEENDLTPADLSRAFGDYLDEAHRLRKEYEGRITLLIGLETDYITHLDLDNLQTLLSAESSRIEYLVGSVHHVKTIPIDFDKPTYEKAVGACAGDDSSRSPLCNFLHAYFDAQHELLMRFQPEVVGHFDLCRLYTPNVKLDDNVSYPGVWEKVKRNVQVVIDYGGLFEMNAASFRKGWDQAYPGRDVLQILLHMGGRVCLSDDSHGPQAVGLNYTRLRAYLREVGVKDIWYLYMRRGDVGRRAMARRAENLLENDAVWQQVGNTQS